LNVTYTISYIPVRTTLEDVARKHGILSDRYIETAGRENFFMREGPFLTFARARSAATLFVPFAYYGEVFSKDQGSGHMWSLSAQGVEKVLGD
jgi:hypothetical protein